MPTATLSDVELYYEEAGRGSPLLFVSGTGGDLRQRPNVFDGPLPRHFRVVAYDQRGLGQSSVPPGPYTMTQYGDDAAGLLGHLGIDRASVVGASFGGMVAQELAVAHPDRVERLVLACTSAGGAGGSSYPLHELVELAPDERAAVSIRLADVRIDDAWVQANPERWQALVATRRPEHDDPHRKEGARLQLEARRGHDAWGRLGSISCPTLVCGGKYDGIAPRANSENLARAIPGARLAMFEGGHMFLVQDKAALSEIIAFLTEA